MSSFNQRGCYGCGGPLDGLLCRRCTCEWCGNNLRDGFCSFCNARARNSFIYDLNPTSFDNPPDFSYQPPQPQYKTYLCELCGNDSYYGYDCPPRFPLVANIDQLPLQEMSIQELEDLKQHYLDEMLSLSNDLGIKDYRYEKIDIQFRRECEDMIDELKEDIECKVSYDSNLDESTFQVTPLSDSNKDECFTSGDDVELLLHHDPFIPKMSVVSILEGFTDEPPLKDNDDLFDLESKEIEWKKILYNDR
nr:pre-mRNA splicing Prp18-interacting factor [Tanacetum cinerariifolium]